MKNFFFLLAFISFYQYTCAQDTTPVDPRLVDYLGSDNIALYQSEYPEKLAYYQYFMENMIIVQEMGTKDISVFPDVSTVIKVNSNAPDLNEQTDFNTINPFHYNFGSFSEQKIFRIGNSNSALIARPESFLRSEYLKQQE
jgi:hypothetical protein